MEDIAKLAEHFGSVAFLLIGLAAGWKLRAELMEGRLRERVTEQHETIRDLKGTVDKLRDKLGYL